MKQLLTLIFVFCAMVTTANAQGKKTWAFQEAGLSPQTIANLDADEENWTKEGTNEEGTTGWKEAKKHSGAIKANGVVLPEMAGIELVNTALQKDNNIIIRKDRMRINRDKMKFKLPKLANGQTITIDCQSANSTATNRGVKASYDYMKRIEGPEDNLIPGPSGLIRNVWQVETDETDSVDIEFTMITGGIDFRLIQIDGGDVLQTAKVIYLYDGTEDIVLNYLSMREATELTAFDVTTSTITAESLQDFDVAIVGASLPADNAVVATLKEAMPWTPILNFNAQLYTAWGYGTPVEAPGFIKIQDSKNALFKDVDYEESDEGNVIIYSNSGFETTMQAVTLGEFFNADVIAGVTTGEEASVAIHTHNVFHNGYIYLPYVADLSDAGIKLLENAIVILQNSKSKISAAPAPILSREYKHLQTIVTMTPPALPKAHVFYTTDGSDPTEESTEYTDPIILTSECTIRAAATAEGYTLSKVAELEVLIKEQPAAPIISHKEGKGKTQLFFECSTPEAKIWYNFKNSTDTITSSLYTPDSIDVVILMPQDVTAFATVGEPGEAVFSELTQQRVLVRKPRVVIDVAAHYRAAKWDDVANGGGVFPNGKSATSMYDTSADPIGTIEDPETGDEVALYPEVEWMTRDEPGETPEWQLMSKGQAVLWQSNSISTDKTGTDEGGYYPSVAEDIDPLFPATSYDIQFAAIFAGEPANAAIMSKNKYQAPLDIVTFANMQGGPLVAQVSTDGENWTTVGDEIAKTGFKRMWKKYTNSYNGTDEVYVRVAQTEGSSAAKIFDIFVANEGEKSKALLDELHAEYGDWDDEPGDVNGDGSVDVADISAIITVMAGTADYSYADVNNDGTVDVADISAVITIMAGL